MSVLPVCGKIHYLTAFLSPFTTHQKSKPETFAQKWQAYINDKGQEENYSHLLEVTVQNRKGLL